MSDKTFIDTNIFVYVFSPSSPEKQKIASTLVQQHISKGTAVISSQVLQEFLNVAYKQQQNLFGNADFERYLNKVLYPLMQIFPSKELYQQATDICLRWKISFYDSLIVAAALEANCAKICSEDLQHGLKIYSLEVENPFRVI